MKRLNCYFEFRKNDNTLFLSDNISKIHNYEHFQQKNKLKFITGPVTGSYRNIFQVLKSRSRIKNSKANYEKGMSQSGNMDSQ